MYRQVVRHALCTLTWVWVCVATGSTAASPKALGSEAGIWRCAYWSHHNKVLSPRFSCIGNRRFRRDRLCFRSAVASKAKMRRSRWVASAIAAADRFRKEGSIEDNRLGGWYSYRASKAALNMFIKTASIEIKRTKPNAVLAALHHGTATSLLSKPFRGAEIGRAPNDAAADMLDVIDSLTPPGTGQFYSYTGERLPW